MFDIGRIWAQYQLIMNV